MLMFVWWLKWLGLLLCVSLCSEVMCVMFEWIEGVLVCVVVWFDFVCWLFVDVVSNVVLWCGLLV